MISFLLFSVWLPRKCMNIEEKKNANFDMHGVLADLNVPTKLL
jgi:hypothetical protein